MKYIGTSLLLAVVLTMPQAFASAKAKVLVMDFGVYLPTEKGLENLAFSIEEPLTEKEALESAKRMCEKYAMTLTVASESASVKFKPAVIAAVLELEKDTNGKTIKTNVLGGLTFSRKDADTNSAYAPFESAADCENNVASSTFGLSQQL